MTTAAAALAAPTGWSWRRARSTPSPAATPGEAAWRQPEPVIAALVLLLLIVVIGRHPLSRALGTEVDAAPLPLATPTRITAPVLPAAPQQPASPPVPTHPAVDPFRPLVTTSGSLVARETLQGAPVTAHVPSSRPSHGGAARSGTAHTAPAGCASRYVVHRGDSLWAIAAQHNLSWPSLYAANRAAVGSDPSLLRVGTSLCLTGHG